MFIEQSQILFVTAILESITNLRKVAHLTWICGLTQPGFNPVVQALTHTCKETVDE